MPPLMQLPAYQTPNALMNFAPVSDGIDSYRKGQEDVRRFGVAQQAGNALMGGDYKGAMATALQGDRADLAGLAMQAKAHASQEESAALDREHKTALMYGGVAQQAIQSGDPNVMRQTWGRMVASHPEFAAKVQAQGVDPNDHASGLKFIMAQAAGYRNPLDDKLKQAQINAANYRQEEPVIRQLRAAGIDPRSEQGRQLIMNSIKGGSPMEQMIAEGMRNAMKQGQTAPQPAQQQGGIVQQSFDGGQPDGGIINVQTAPQQVQQQAPAEPMVNTPLGPLPKRQADIMGFGLAMQGKGEAGKMMMGQDERLSKSATEQNDKGALNSIEQSSRLDSIAAKFKPEYQTYEFAAKNMVNKGLDSFAATRGSIKPQDRQKMAEYSQFRQDAMNNLSAYIKEITGAAMGIQEEKRIRAGMPDPEKDSPTEFEAKMKGAISTAKLALARHAYLKRSGYDDNSIAALAKSDKLGTVHSLEDMKSLINGRMEAAAQQIRQQNPNIDDMTLRQTLKQIQRKEFGI